MITYFLMCAMPPQTQVIFLKSIVLSVSFFYCRSEKPTTVNEWRVGELNL